MAGKGALRRGPELAALAAAYVDGTDLVVVSGEAGVGKTRLVTDFLESIPVERSVTVKCFELAGELVSFSALRQTMLEMGADPDRSDDKATGRLQQFSHWVSVLDSRRSGDGRAVLVLEDVHWGDHSTFDFLTYIASGPERSKPFVVVTRRIDAAESRGEAARAMAELLRLPRVRHVEVLPLSSEAAVEMATELSQGSISEDGIRALAKRSGGNPYLLCELVEAGGALPRHVQDVLLARTRSLGADANALLILAAAAGTDISDEILSAAAGMAPAAYRSAVDSLAATGVLLYDQHLYTFRHALTREAVLNEAPPVTIKAAHLALAAALEQFAPVGPVTLATIALHWRASGDRVRAAPATVAAARAATASYAFAEARQLYRWVLELYGERAPLDVTLEAAESARWSGALDDATGLLRRALAHTESKDQRLVVLERLGRYLWEAGDAAASSAVLEEATELIPSDRASSIRASVTGARARAKLSVAEYVIAEKLAAEARSVARELGDLAVEADALNTLGVAMAMQGHESGPGCVQEALHLSLSADSAEGICRAYSNLLFIHEILGHPVESLEVVEDGLSTLRKRGLLLGRGAAFANNAVAILLDRGLVDEAAQILDELTANNPPQGRAQRLRLLQADVALVRDDRASARRYLNDARSLQGVDEPWIIAAFAVLEAELFILERDLDTAATIVATALGRISDAEPRAVTMLSRAALRIAADRHEQGRSSAGGLGEDYCTRLLANLPQDDEPTPDASVGIHRQVARLEAARRHGRDEPDQWRAAALAWAQIHRPRDMAYCRYREAVRLSQQRRFREAADVVAIAREAASQIGDVPLLRSIDSLIRGAALVPPADPASPTRTSARRATAGPEPSALDQRFGLTTREHEVLALLADGATNRHISERLYISERTAAVHVSAVLRKLGVANRLQAASLFHKYYG